MNISEVIVILRSADGTFEEPIISPIKLITSSWFRAAVDFNSDSLLDIVLGGWPSGSVHVLLGNGDGKFHDIIFFAKNCRTIGDLSVGNLNNDRFLDFAIVCLSPNNINVIFGNTNGTFAENALLNVGLYRSPTSVQIADLNGDNYGDVVVYDGSGWSVNVFLGQGNGSFAMQKISFVRTLLYPISLAFGDFNEDTIQDLIFTWIRYENAAGVAWAFGYNDGTFDVPIYFNLTNNRFLRISAVSDFNNDGHLDLVIARDWFEHYTLSIYFGDGNGNFEFYTIFSSEVFIGNTYVAAVDFNADGYKDIFAAFESGPYIFSNTGQCDNASEMFQTSTSIYN